MLQKIFEGRFINIVKSLMAAFLVFVSIGLSSCEREGPAERAGEEIDESIEEFGDEVEDATDR
ncbi:MAG: hypothetical protein R6U50_04260 [Desulfobacterales bacterium]